MANLKKFIQFTIQWEGDGTNSHVLLKFLTDPVQFNVGAGTVLFWDVTKSLPSAVSNVAVGGATLSSSSYNSALGELTVIFSAAPAAGALGNITGYAEYN